MLRETLLVGMSNNKEFKNAINVAKKKYMYNTWEEILLRYLTKTALKIRIGK